MATSNSSPSLASALKYMVLAAALYEPLRNALHRLGQDVGGVGGVGGLCNMGNPDGCKSLAGQTQNYCFLPGVWSGLTWFAIVVLLAWTCPLFLGALRMSTVSSKRPAEGDAAQHDTESHQGQDADPGSAGAASFDVNGLLTIWSGLSCLWFATPLTYMLADPFYRSGVVNVILAVALAAAFPLSWHLRLC